MGLRLIINGRFLKDVNKLFSYAVSLQTMKLLLINDNDDNDQVNPPKIISPLGLRFSNFSPVGFVKEGCPGEQGPHSRDRNMEILSRSSGHVGVK